MKIAVAGAAGRMGQMLIREIARTEGCTLAGALEGAGNNAIGCEAGDSCKRRLGQSAANQQKRSESTTHYDYDIW